MKKYVVIPANDVNPRYEIVASYEDRVEIAPLNMRAWAFITEIINRDKPRHINDGRLAVFITELGNCRQSLDITKGYREITKDDVPEHLICLVRINKEFRVLSK